MPSFPCPYLNASVELTDERERHIAEHHPELLPSHREWLAETLADPDQIRRSPRFANARLFTRAFTTTRGERHVVVVVVTDAGPRGRNWIVTAYTTRRLVGGEVEWKRS